jgi:hypothetical protein
LAKGQVRPEKSAYHSIALPPNIPEKDISLLLLRACSTMDKIVDRYALTIYPYSLEGDFKFIKNLELNDKSEKCCWPAVFDKKVTLRRFFQ